MLFQLFFLILVVEFLSGAQTAIKMPIMSCPRRNCSLEVKTPYCLSKNPELCYFSEEKCNLDRIKNEYNVKEEVTKFGCEMGGGEYLKTMHGTVFIASKNDSQKRSWIGAWDECCARGGYLASLEDVQFYSLIANFADQYPGIEYWVGGIEMLSSEGLQEKVWCEPDKKTAALKRASVFGNAENCLRLMASGEEVANCSEKKSYICSNIHTPFPDSCFHPYIINAQGEIRKSFLWTPWTQAKVPNISFPIVLSAEKTHREPGQPYYFSCGSKTYMGIMAEFSRMRAGDRCQLSGMQMLSIDSIKEMQCILNFFQGTMSSLYWTSGINLGTQNLTTYGWCSTGKMVNAKLWAERAPWDPQSNRCVALTVMQDDQKLSGLASVHCNFLLPLICQQ